MISISFWWLYFFPEHWIIERLVDNWWNFILMAVLYIYRTVWLKIDWLRLVTCHTTYWHSNSGVKMKCASADQSKIGDSITVQQPVQIKTKEKERKHQTQYGVMTKLSVRQSGTDKKKHAGLTIIWYCQSEWLKIFQEILFILMFLDWRNVHCTDN